jgi:hypothetical protein
MDRTDPHASDATAPSSEGFSDWSVVDGLLPGIIHAHHSACPHALTGAVRLGARLPEGFIPDAEHAVHIHLTCAVCSLVASVCCHWSTASPWTSR